MTLGNVCSWVSVRFGLVFLTWSVVTFNYCWFSHSIHNRHTGGPGDKKHGHNFAPDHGDHHDDHHEDHRHGRGAFEFDLKTPGFFLYGLALPLVLLTLSSLIWNPSTSAKGTTSKNSMKKGSKSMGEVNVTKWTLIWFLTPLLLVMLDGALGAHMSQAQGHQMGWGLYIRICMSLMSPSGYAATWALALFLIPVTKHSPILDWLGVTPVQALAFHRVAGWTSFWNSVLHGFLHLRHLMDVLNPGHKRPWYQQLRILLIPDSWECLGTQNPWDAFWGIQDPMKGATTAEANQCWLALVNATGMISVLAFVLLAATSLPQVRRYSYKLFYTVHIPCAWIMLIMAIWHYPTCALVLIPNIIYYLSFNIPVYITQTMEYFRNAKKSTSPLVEANLIQGGSIDLVFAIQPEDRHRHESRFAKIYCPSVSPLSHPFSVFSRQDMKTPNGADSTDELTTVSIILKPTGPFTQGACKALFPTDNETGGLTEPLVNGPSPLSPAITLDSFYAASFDWVDHAMSSHDEILLIAGGAGIVPFLEFLPSLQQRIEADTSAAPRDSDSILESVGPKRIHLHWYCREVGLASYVWYNYLRDHIQQRWEKNDATQGRLKIHLHLTSLNGSNSSREGEEILSGVENSGLSQKQTYGADTIKPAQDARFTQSRCLGLLLPGSLMVIGILLHWWWYKQYILADQFRHDNLIIRSHSIIFTLILAMVLSIIAEHCIYKKEQSHSATPILSTRDSEDTMPMNDQVLSVSKGRPPVDGVIEGIIKADRPGTYLCGPRSLMESVEGSICSKRSDCAFYRENSEM